MKKQPHHWAYEELESKLRKSDLDRLEIGTMFLVDPEMNERLDGIIKQQLWPAVLEGLRGSTFGIFNQSKILNGIRTTRSQMLTRELVFLLEDPARPINSEPNQRVAEARGCLAFPTMSNRLWQVRGVLEVRFDAYSVGFDLSLEFPGMIDVRRLVPFVMNPVLEAASPRLGGDLSGEQPCYVLTLSKSLIARHGDHRLEPERIVPESVRKHLDIIWVADRLADSLKHEEDMSEALTDRSVGLFEALADRLVACYGDMDVSH